jgi:hypothetical protein
MSIALLAGLVVFAVVVWFAWSLLSTTLRAKAISRMDDKVNETVKELQNLAAKSENNFSRIVLEKVDLQDMWARVRTRILVTTKRGDALGEVIRKFSLLVAEGRILVKRDVHVSTLVQVGHHDLDFYKEISAEQKASLSAIDQLIADIKKDLS